MGEWMYRSTLSSSQHLLEVSGCLTHWPVYPQQKSLWQPLDRRLGGFQNRYEHSEEEKILYLPGNKLDSFLGCPSNSQSLY
jgi:hypothetical protein